MLSLSLSLFPREGVDVLGPQCGLRAGCFIGLEAVRYLTQKMVDNPRRRDVVRVLQVRGKGSGTENNKQIALYCTFLQRMINSGHLIHASGNCDVRFIDGYYLYRIVEGQ